MPNQGGVRIFTYSRQGGLGPRNLFRTGLVWPMGSGINSALLKNRRCEPGGPGGKKNSLCLEIHGESGLLLAFFIFGNEYRREFAAFTIL